MCSVVSLGGFSPHSPLCLLKGVFHVVTCVPDRVRIGRAKTVLSEGGSRGHQMGTEHLTAQTEVSGPASVSTAGP